jgi:hypothetical protein
MVARYDLVWGRIAERIRAKESMGILCQRKALWESTLRLERLPQEVLFRLKAILQDNGDQSILAPRSGGERERVRGETHGP